MEKQILKAAVAGASQLSLRALARAESGLDFAFLIREGIYL